MALEAPLSKYTRQNFYIGIVACVALALWFGYDGYISKTFQEEHAQWVGFNRVAPFVLLPTAAILGVWLCTIRNRKVVATDDALIVAGKRRIPYDAIEKIDKTYYEKKGFFTIVYKNEQGRESSQRLSDHQFDHLGPILDHVIAQIT